MEYNTLYNQTKNLSILFVEDYADLRESTVEVLENYFNYCECAEDGQIGLQKYYEFFEKNGKYFDIVLTDIRMPNVDGVMLTEMIKEINKNQSIIVLSAHTESEYLLKLINLSINQFVSKPIESELFLDTLYKVSCDINKNDRVQSNKNIVKISNNIYYDLLKKILFKDDEIVKLTKHEDLLLQLFVQKIDYICSNSEIVNYFHSNSIELSTKNIRALVSKLRKKLPSNTIDSLYSIGYKLKNNA